MQSRVMCNNLCGCESQYNGRATFGGNRTECHGPDSLQSFQMLQTVYNPGGR